MYFKIGNNDYSMFVNDLKVAENVKYTAQENAAGNTVVDYLNKKRTITVGIIPLNSNIMKQLKTDINNFNVKISFLNPNTETLETNVNCIIPANEVSYYTIQADKVMFDAVSLTFTEL